MYVYGIATFLQVGQVEYSLPTCMRRFVSYKMEVIIHRSSDVKFGYQKLSRTCRQSGLFLSLYLFAVSWFLWAHPDLKAMCSLLCSYHMFNHQIMALYIHLCSWSLVWGWITVAVYTIWGQKQKPRTVHSDCEFSERSQWESWRNFRHSGKRTIHVRLHLPRLSSQMETPLLGSHSHSPEAP